MDSPMPDAGYRVLNDDSLDFSKNHLLRENKAKIRGLRWV